MHEDYIPDPILLFTAISAPHTRSVTSHVMRKPYFCLCVNKGADHLCSNCTADQRLCFRYSDSTISLLLLKISKLQAATFLLRPYRPVCVGPGRKSRRPVFSRRGSVLLEFNNRCTNNFHTQGCYPTTNNNKHYLFSIKQYIASSLQIQHCSEKHTYINTRIINRSLSYLSRFHQKSLYLCLLILLNLLVECIHNINIHLH